MATKYKLSEVVCLMGLLVAFPITEAQSQLQRQLTGPSFNCPIPRDPLAQLICDTPELSRFDLLFTQTYQALRQQLAEPVLQQSLRQESLDFGRAVRSACGIAFAQSANSKSPIPPPAPPGAGSCVFQAYQRQRAIWHGRLFGAAAEEAARPLEQQIKLQTALQNMKLLSTTDALVGVFGPLTRAAITAWQLSTGRQGTGLLGNTDARDLLQAASVYVDTNPNPVPTREAVTQHEEIERLLAAARTQNNPGILKDFLLSHADIMGNERIKTAYFDLSDHALSHSFGVLSTLKIYEKPDIQGRIMRDESVGKTYILVRREGDFNYIEYEINKYGYIYHGFLD